ncbi:MAG TPA: alpha/beta hydrolase [Xanthobacteraceae bacterium]|nr:alpha/beta hydrolase [Xanthobacteraceae bacterium]
MRDGAVIRLRQYGAGGRRLALSHGNGLAINAYLPFWQPLAENFELIVFDQRNHGENPLHDPASHDWDHIVADAREIAAGIDAHFGAKPTVGVFHSMSACVALMAALRFGSPWSALALFDPPLFPPTGHPLQPVELAEMKNLASRTRRRSQRFNSVEQFAVQLRRSPVFSSWVPGAHLLFAQSTLRKSGEEWILCNSSELEARIYETNDDASVWQNITSLPCPALLIGADPSYRYASAPASMCKAVHDERDVPYVMIPDTTHFLQMEKPEACRAALESFLATVS